MQKFISKKNKDIDYNEIKVKEYLSKYLIELQRHFDISDRKMRYILLKVYRELSPINFVKNWISVVKSEYRRKIRELGWK